VRPPRRVGAERPAIPACGAACLAPLPAGLLPTTLPRAHHNHPLARLIPCALLPADSAVGGHRAACAAADRVQRPARGAGNGVSVDGVRAANVANRAGPTEPGLQGVSPSGRRSSPARGALMARGSSGGGSGAHGVWPGGRARTGRSGCATSHASMVSHSLANGSGCGWPTCAPRARWRSGRGRRRSAHSGLSPHAGGCRGGERE